MDRFTIDNIKNVCLLGHSGSGKTSLIESALFYTKATDRLGKPSDGNTVCDSDPEEIRRGFSLSAAIAPVIWKNKKINFIDAPGYLDFVGEVYQAIASRTGAIIVVDAKAEPSGRTSSGGITLDAGIEGVFHKNPMIRTPFQAVLNDLRRSRRFGLPDAIPMAEDHQVSAINLIDQRAY